MDGRKVDAARKALGNNTKRRLAAVVALALLLTIAAPPRAIPPGEGWPTGWLTSIASVRFAFAKDPDTPKQGRGKAPGGHYVGQAFVKDGRKSKPAKGELRAYAPHRPAEATRVAGGSGTGFDRGASKLVAKDSTARSEIYRNTDGSFTRRVFEKPVNFKAADGTWKPIDSKLRRSGNRYAVTANSLGISFSGAPAEPLVRFSPGAGTELAYDLAGATIGQPVVDREVATYRDVLPGVDLELGAQSDAAKETLILKSADAPTEFVFPLHLTGLTPKINKLGGLDLADPAGRTVLTMPLGFLEDAKVDASGSGALGYGVKYTLDGQSLKVSIDGAWLRDPARRFPVRLDPTSRVADSTNDTYVQSTPVQNRVSEDNVAVGTFNGGSTTARALLPFPTFGSTYAGKNISGAILNVFMSYQGVGTGCVARAFNVNPVTANWSPGAIPMSSFPSFGGSIGSASPSSTAACNNTATTRNVGVWSRPGLAVGPLNDWITGGNNYGLALTASESDSTAWKRFTSAEPNLTCNHSVYGAIQCDPFLEITYTDNGVPQIDERYPANNATVGSITPELVAAGHDVDSFPNKGLRYNFLLYNDQGAQITTSGWTAGAWRVPAGLLAWNKTYIYAVQVNDWSSTGPAAPEPYAFTTQVPQAAVTSSLAQNGGKGFEPNVGNYTNSDTDAQVETTGPALAITRDYNSLDTRIDGSFAQGWSSILDMAATEAVDGGGVLQTVTVRYPNGQDVAFGRNNDGVFIPPPGRFSVFKAITGGYSLTDKDTTTYEFTQRNGTRLGLTKITDSNGRGLILRYDANGRPDQMKSLASNRTLTFAWIKPAGAIAFHVETVTTDPVDATDPGSALVWHYGYDADRLIRVCPPSSTNQCTTYEYTGASQYVNVTANTSPYLYWRLNEAPGATTAANHEVTSDGADGATYSNVTLGVPGPFPGSTATAASFNGTSSSIHLPIKAAQRSGYQSISLWFKTSTAGGILYAYQKDLLTAAAAPCCYNPVLYIGSEGKLYGELWNGGATPMVSPAPVNNDQWHHAVITGYGNTQKLYLDGTQIGTLAGSISLFDEGLTNAYVGGGYSNNGWPGNPGGFGAPSWFNGTIAEVSVHDRAISAADVTDTYTAGTRPTAELSKITSPGGRVRAQIAFDTVSGRVGQVTDENGGVWGVGAPARGGSSAVYVSSVLGSQPTDYWRLNDISAPAEARNSALQNRATYHDVTFDTTQPNTTSPFADSFGGGFNGTSSFVSIDNPDPDGWPATDAPVEGPASVELWFKEPAGTTSSGVLYSYQEGQVNGSAPATANWTPALYVGNDGYLRGTFWTGSVAVIQSPTTVNDGKWHHVVLAASPSQQTLYLDGNNVGSRAGTMTPTQFSYTYVGAGTTRLWPGASGDVSYFKGNIAEVAYYGRELTEADVDAHFRASASVAQPGDATTGSTLTPVNTVSVTDPTGKIAKQTFDVINGNRMVASTDTLGNTTTYGYDLGGFESVVYDPIGQKTVTGKDVRGNAIRTEVCHRQGYLNGCDITYMKYWPDSTTTNLTPDPRNDQLTDIREPGSQSETDNTYWTHYDYDTAGNRTKMTGPAVVDFPAGRVTTLTYTDASTVAQGGGTPPPGLPARVVSPGGATQTTEYYASGDTFRMTDAGGLPTEFTYDGVGRTRTKTVKAGGAVGDLTTTLTYDADGQVVAQVDPPVLNAVTGATHRTTTVTGYDPDGSVVSRRVTDTPEGGDSSRDVTSDYDAHGRMIKTVDPVGLVTLFGYDVYGHKTKTTACSSSPDPGSPCPSGDILKVQTNTYDSEGHQLVTTIIDGDGNSTKVADRAYYPTGNLASETDAMNWTTKYQYDNSDEPTEITRTDGTRTHVVERNHYLNGKLDEQYTNNGASHKNFEYDQAGRLVRERDGLTSGDPVGQRLTGYVYDGDDHVLATRFGTLTYGGDDPASYYTVLGTQTSTYDAMGRVTSSTESTDRASKPSAWWKFNETGGDEYLDSSGSLRTIRNADPGGGGITRSDGAAVINKTSFIWDESGPVVDTSKSYTVSTWVKMNNFGTAGSAVAQTGLNTTAVNLGYNKSLNRWSFAAPSADSSTATVNNASSSTALTAGAWVNLVGTYDAASKAMKLYVNGALGGTATNNTPWQARAPLSIGWSLFADDQLDGAVDNVQWYERALDASEVTTMFTGGRAGNVTGGTGQLTTRYTVDNRGLTTAKTDPNNNVTSYEYDTIGQLTKEIDPATNVESYGAGAPVSATPVTRYGYNAFGEQTEIQDPLNNTSTTRLDAAGRPVRTTLPSYTPPGGAAPIADAHTSIEYDQLGRVSAEENPLGERTTYEYDIFGNRTKVTNPAGKVSTATFDPLGDQLESVDPAGARTTTTYDMLSRRLTRSVVVRQPTAQTYTTTYDYGTGAFGTGPWLQKMTSPAGVAVTNTYNAYGEAVTVKDGAGNVTRTDYDGLGQATQVTNPDSTKRITVYDGAGRVTSTQELDNANALLRSQSVSYDGNDNVLTTRDGRNNVTSFTYDAADNVTSEAQPVTATSSITTTFGYDLAGRRVRFSDGRGNPFWTTYNSWGMPESQVEPATTAYPSEADRTFSLAYDAAGRAARLLSPGGVEVVNRYDERGLLTEQTGSGAEAATEDRTFAYDDAGRMTAFSVPGGTDTVSYDDRGLPLAVNGPQDASSFSYNQDGQVAARTDAAGTTNFTYDTAGRFKTAANSTTGVNLSVNYNTMSQPEKLTYGGAGNARTLTYDKLHRLTGDALKNAAGTTTLGSITYGYDGNDNLTSKVTTGFAGAGSNTYAYDFADRLTSWTSAGGTVAYAYDNSGNRTQNGTKTFTYDARNQLQTQNDGTSYSYTPRGTLAHTISGSVDNATTADAFGQIISQAAAGGTSRYAYDALGRAVRDGFSYTGLDNDLAKDSEFTYTRGVSGELLAEGAGTGAGSVNAWTDQHDDVVGRFTSTGTALTGSVTYDPFGVVKAGSGLVGHLGYQSEWTDTITGRVNMMARWYNPDTGQFDSRDTAANSPVPDSINANRFQYGDANPLTTTDPTGHWGFKSVFKAASNFVVNNVVKPAVAVAQAVTAPARAAFNYVASGRAWNDVKKVTKAVAKKATKAWNVVKESTTRWAKKKINAVKDAYHSAQKCLSKGVSKCAKDTAKAVAKKAVDTVKSTVQAIKEDPWKFIATAAAGLVATVAVGALCATGVGCLILAGAVAGAMASGAGYMVDVGRGDQKFSWSGLAGTMIEGGLDGALSAGVSKFTGGVTKGLMGGAAKGAGGLANKFRGERPAGYSPKHRAGGESPAGGSPSAPRGNNSGGSRSGDRSPSERGSRNRPGCPEQEHSFEPSTRVLMADGTTKPIEDIQVGDKVTAADPETGRSGARAVTLLHINRDTDLAEVTLKDKATGKSTTLNTTQNHPFWDATDRKWVEAADLAAGHRLLVGDRAGGEPAEGDSSGAGLGGGGPGTAMTVSSVASRSGAALMRDLTVDEIHTYYVMAGAEPVLVHNINGCSRLYRLAHELNQQTRSDPEHQNVAAGLVRHRTTGEEQTWVTTEGDGIPEDWQNGMPDLRGAIFRPGPGDAEWTLMDLTGPGSDWELVSMASAVRMCPSCFDRATGMGLSPTGIGRGNGTSRTGNTPHRTVTRR